MKPDNSHYFAYLAPPHWLKRLIIAASFGGLLTACGESKLNDLEQYIADARTKHQGTIEPLPAITQYETYRYHADQLRDPFKPSVSLVKSISLKSRNGISPNEKRNKEELEKYALESLSMVGVMHNQGLTWGIIKAPDNSIYRVRKGNYMGLNHGRIAAIKENKIELKEIVSDGLGGWIERPNKIVISE